MKWIGTPAVLLAVVALIGASCGGDGGQTSGQPAAQADQASPVEPATEQDCAAPIAEIQLVALESEAGEPPSFNKDCISVPVGEPFTVSLRNKDFLEHNFSLFTDEDLSELLFRGDRFRGPGETLVYDVPAIQESGPYTFVCDVHLTLMRGTLQAQ